MYKVCFQFHFPWFPDFLTNFQGKYFEGSLKKIYLDYPNMFILENGKELEVNQEKQVKIIKNAPTVARFRSHVCSPILNSSDVVSSWSSLYVLILVNSKL